MKDEVLSQFTPNVHENDVIDPGRVLKFGVIGAGWIAESYVENIMHMPDIKIIAAAERTKGKAEKFFAHYGIDGVRLYQDHREMLDAEPELDAVCVCTYNRTHAECAIDALRKGVNVLLEKPMSVTVEEAVDIIRAEKASGKLLSLGFQPRMDENMRMIKKIVDSGELGKVYYIQTGGGRRRGIPNSSFIEKKTAGIGALGDIGCYSLDMVLNAVGYPRPLTISGYRSAYFGPNPKYNNPIDAARFDVEDFAAAFIRLEGDIVLDFRIAWAMHIDTPGDTILLGTEGALRIPSTECWDGALDSPMILYRDAAGARIEYEIPLIKQDESLERGGIFYKKIRSFANAIKTGGEAPVPSHQIFINQVIIDGIMKSSELGREIEVQMPDTNF